MKPGTDNIIGKGFDVNKHNINRNGRPRKYVSQLKIDGYKLSEINDTIQNMLSLNSDELKKIFDDPKATILEKTISQDLRKSIERGNLDSMETLLTRIYGKPKQEMDITTGGDKLNKPTFEIKIINNGESFDNQIK